VTRALAKAPAAPAEDRADTPELLLLTAMRLFAEQGIDRVSLKTISDAAGNRNKSAVGYHFNNKQGLIDSVLRRLESDLAPQTSARIAAFEAELDRGHSLPLGEVVLGLMEPVLLLYATTAYGRDALRVLARMMHDPLDSMPTDLRRSCNRLIERAVEVLHRILPDKPLNEMQHHVHHAIMATVNGLAMQQRFIERGESRWSRLPLSDLFLSYAGYVTAGLAGRPLKLDPALEGAWKQKMNALLLAS
jgi:AcrR family transcriptional regulator